MIIAHNMPAMFTDRQLGINKRTRIKAMERLSSGYKVNKAADNASGLSISEKMRGQIRGLMRGAQNVQEGISFCNVADGALQEVHSVLQRIRELSVQAASDTNVSADRKAINGEIDFLKKEINRISLDTEYNTYNIFSTAFELQFSDDLNVIQVFDANDGDPTDPDSYGGIIVNGDTRVAWNAIDPHMVTKDPVTGKTVFTPGTYTYNTGKCDLEIVCKDGSKPPEIKVEFPVSATSQGLNIAGDIVDWKDVVNEYGESILTACKQDGYYSFQLGNGMGSFTIADCDSIDDVIKGLNHYNKKYSRKYVNVYDGYYRAQAVDMVDTGSTMRVTNQLFNTIVNHGSLNAKLQADTSGIWVVDASGNSLAASKKTWDELGIHSWDSLNDISDRKTYQYSFKDTDYDIQFDFNLLDETSIDSVIAGINNATIQQTGMTSNNEMGVDIASGSAILSGDLKYANNKLDIYEEGDMGRDFDIQSEILAEENMTYDKDNNRFSLIYNDSTGVPKYEYASVGLPSLNEIKSNTESYLQYLYNRGISQILNGASSMTTPTLEDIVGAGNVTGTGWMSETVTIDKTNMSATGNIQNGNYPAATIDFSGYGTSYQWYDLLGTGFDSTCMTCDNHYSMMFVYEGCNSTTSEGYKYSKEKNGSQDYILKIDLKSIADQGITNGADFTKALVNILDESEMDFHYTQYVADQDKLYICDNRSNYIGDQSAKFDTKPYKVNDAEIELRMQEKNSSKNFGLSYTYDLKSSVSAVVNMTKSQTGAFVENGTGGYKAFVYSDYFDAAGNLKPGITAPPERYDIEFTNNITSWEDYYDKIMTDIADQSKINIHTTDYDYVDYLANERPNQATVSTFEFKIEEDKGFWIQSGANSMQGVALIWDGFSTYSLGIGKGNVKTQEDASDLISRTDKAIEKISDTRITFGAYMNRMEYMYDLDRNSAENLQASESKIRDADMADEMVSFSTADILAQAATSMLVQANRIDEGVLQLLQ